MFDPNRHMGYIFIDTMKRRPDEICHIDAATEKSETNSSVLHRSIRLANSMKRFGLKSKDVLAIGGRNHIDIHIPYYAALMNGLPIVGVDPLFKIDEIKSLFKVSEPKIAFCDPDFYECYKEAATQLGLNVKIVKFGRGPESLEEFLGDFDDDTPDDQFKPADFEADKVYAWLVSSGGTTGVLKLAAITHSTWIHKMNNVLISIFAVCGSQPGPQNLPNKLGLNLSPVQWISSYFNAMSMPILHQTKLQTSASATTEHVIDIINKYKPATGLLGPSLVSSILKSNKPCDMSCFESIVMSGGKIYPDLWVECRARLPKTTKLLEAYGQTENLGPVFTPNPMGPVGSCGKMAADVQIKLVDPETGKEITEPNVTGELWTKCIRFSEYYNNPEETAKAFTEDGWYKTGDLLYHDDDGNFFFVERLKMLIKYRNYHIIPPELESVIRTHQGVLEVSVTSIPHPDDGEHAVACVVKRPGADVTEQEIKDLVAEKLSETKQLRGGVIFLKELPMTSAGKVARAKLRLLVSNMVNNNLIKA